ncbi:MAG TPA: hypothetical protein PLR99_24830 [Polyangiaceae bacterium]|nr:hypothetical protein [Polyangiaceae bacterium]
MASWSPCEERPTPGFAYFRVRPDRSAGPRHRAPWLLALSLGAVSACALASLLCLPRLEAEAARLAALAGCLVLLAAVVLGLGALVTALLENAHLGVRDDGLVFHDDRGQVALAWGDIASIAQEHGVLVVREQDGGERHFHLPDAADAIVVAERLEQVRRRAAFGLGARSLRL